MDANRDTQIFEFCGFRLDAAQRRLMDTAGTPIELPSRAFDLLHYLVERPGQLLEKSTLLKGVWPTTVVEEGNLSQCIFVLRRALGDTASDHRFIVTLPGRGYQFIAPVTCQRGGHVKPNSEVEPEPGREALSASPRRHYLRWSSGLLLALLASGAAWHFWPAPALMQPATSFPENAPSPELQTLAVLPFNDLSPAKDMEYFTEGIADELIDALARAGRLRVIGRRSAFAFKDSRDDIRTIGEKLKVAAILEGSVRKEGNRVRITAQLTRTNDGFSLWTQSFDRNLDNVLDVQGTIAHEVVNALIPTVQALRVRDMSALEASATKNPDAYGAYLRGKHFFSFHTTASFTRARDEFAHATSLDPGFAIAHAWLARASDQLAGNGIGAIARNRRQASESLDTALRLEPAIADIWWVNSTFFQGPNAPLAMRAAALERALVLSPGDPEVMQRLGDVYFHQGRRNEAFRALERAHEIDPLWTHNSFFLGVTSYMFRGDAARALTLVDQMNELTPADPRGSMLAAIVAMNEGHAMDWDRLIAKAIAADPRDQQTHVYVASEYANLGEWDAALYHARAAQEVAPDSAAGFQAAVHALLLKGDVAGARGYVTTAMTTMPDDFQALAAQAELQYFTRDFAGALHSLLLARPVLNQPAASLRIMPDIDYLPMMIWCERRVGNFERARDVVEVVNRVLAPPLVGGLMEGTQVRIAAANGDRAAVLIHLRTLADLPGPEATFSSRDPIYEPFLKDSEVNALLARIEARRAEWRRVLPKSSMKVPIPPAPASAGS